MPSQLATRNFSLNNGSPRSAAPKFPQLFHQRRNSSQVWRGAWLARKFETGAKASRATFLPRQNLTRAITPFLSGVRAIQRTDYRGHRAKIVRPGPKIKGRSGTTTTPSPPCFCFIRSTLVYSLPRENSFSRNNSCCARVSVNS